MNHVEGTTPYAWPYDAVLDPRRIALIVCGADPASSAAVPHDAAAEANLVALRSAVTQAGGLVVVLQHGAAPQRATLTQTACPSEAVTPAHSDVVVECRGIDGFYGSALGSLLRRSGRDHLLLAGHGLETTVHSTLRRANDRGDECLVVADACTAGLPELRPASISTIEMSGGIFGAVGSTSDVIAALPHSPNESHSSEESA